MRLFELRQRIALAICPELRRGDSQPLEKVSDFAADQCNQLGTGFFDLKCACEMSRARRLALTQVVIEAWEVAGNPDPLRRTCEENICKLVSSHPRSGGLSFDEFNGQGSRTWNELVDGLDEAHQHHFVHTGFIFGEFDRLLERDRHLESFHPVVGTADGRGGTGFGEAPSSWCLPKHSSRTRQIRSALRALDDHWLGDLIGTVCLFGIFWLNLVAGVVQQ